MINVGLSTLKGFPALPQLRKLDISDNRLSGGLNYISDSCPKLESLNMGGNRIKDIETLEPLKKLAELRHIDMFNCDIVAIENYRDKVFQALPQITDLDSFDRSGKEVFDSEEENEEEEYDANGDPIGGSDHDSFDDDDQENQDEDDDDDEENEGDEESSDEDGDEQGDEDEEEPEVDANGLVQPPRHPNESYEEDDDDEDGDIENEENEGDDDDDDDEENEESSIENEEQNDEGHRGTKRPHSDDEENAEEV
ncbi:acidic leucine-rich nuclear phosphoprotein 32 family member B-like isoform X2 [Paramacrobiotus metropolitanus]|nr:acidic leucine-rich nuclear phosphoprotein 32 family member B-like isoform X2 [Paramacrobiotus metropolitanus]